MATTAASSSTMRSSTSRCFIAASSMRIVDSRSLSFARMAAFMSSWMRSFSVLMAVRGPGSWSNETSPPRRLRAGLLRRRGRRPLGGAPEAADDQYSFFGSCMLRTRLKCRFTAAAFLRLRSEVGFS